jgi:hypothetical protein
MTLPPRVPPDRRGQAGKQAEAGKEAGRQTVAVVAVVAAGGCGI